MSQPTQNINQEWLKVLGKGMITLPKRWRDELGIESGNIVKAKKEGSKLVIEAQNSTTVPYRIYSDTEIEKLLEEDKIPQVLVKKIKKKFS